MHLPLILTASASVFLLGACAAPSTQHSAAAAENSAGASAHGSAAVATGAAVVAAVPMVATGATLAVSGAALEAVGDASVNAGRDAAAVGLGPLTCDPELTVCVAPDGPPQL